MAVGSVVTMAARHRLAHVAGVALRRAAWVTAMQVVVVVSAQHRAAHAGKGSTMPCMNPECDEQDRRETYAELARLRATVCAMLRVDPSLIDRLDYQEAGITHPWLVSWWNSHLAADEQRSREERNRLNKARLRAAALAKLTPQERAALDIEE